MGNSVFTVLTLDFSSSTFGIKLHWFDVKRIKLMSCVCNIISIVFYAVLVFLLMSSSMILLAFALAKLKMQLMLRGKYFS